MVYEAPRWGDGRWMYVACWLLDAGGGGGCNKTSSVMVKISNVMLRKDKLGSNYRESKSAG